MSNTDRDRIGRVQTSRNEFIEIQILLGARRRLRLTTGKYGRALSCQKTSVDFDTVRARALFELLGAALKFAILADEQYQDDRSANN